MALGIDPKVDFAFKLVFGSPQHTRVTIHFVNAVLGLPQPITWVEILNPIQGKDFSEDKLVVLDVLAADDQGRRFNIEMQTTLPLALPKRLTYYNCLNYVRQLGSGAPYHALRPAVSICVLDQVLFAELEEYHLSFRLRCDQRALVFSEDLVFHTLELPKFALPSHNIEAVRALPPLEKWLYFLRRAEELEAVELAAMLVDEPFVEATGVLDMISQSPEERLLYEARMKFLHDEQARLLAAREEGLTTGLAKGREEGREEGLCTGRLVGKIQLLQQLVGERESSVEELLQCDPAGLAALLSELQHRLRTRR
jgi:predicted transposase/invertase (TIGR01784 family)